MQHVAVKHAKDLSEVSDEIGSAYRNASFQHTHVNIISLSKTKLDLPAILSSAF